MAELHFSSPVTVVKILFEFLATCSILNKNVRAKICLYRFIFSLAYIAIFVLFFPCRSNSTWKSRKQR
uniref:Uncharacterized protein n=1 Tax=Oryza nivara TaxID=4536 RepID=A0A0E0IBQ5_ORYNI